eukprot:13174308-Alexandrium_andersonii.AAC.1
MSWPTPTCPALTGSVWASLLLHTAAPSESRRGNGGQSGSTTWGPPYARFFPTRWSQRFPAPARLHGIRPLSPHPPGGKGRVGASIATVVRKRRRAFYGEAG